MTEGTFKAHDIGLRAQKKILSRMATKNIAKTFIDGTTASLLDNVYKLCKLHVSIIHNLILTRCFANWFFCFHFIFICFANYALGKCVGCG